MSAPVTGREGSYTLDAEGRRMPPPPGARSSEEIRDDIVRQRQELARSVDQLKSRWSEVTDVKRQVKRHRGTLLVGAAVVGGIVAGAVLLGRRRG